MKFSLKKILLFTFILLEFSALSAFASCPVPVMEKYDGSAPVLGPKISLSFEIARRRDCTGFGICNLQAEITLQRVNSCNANLYVDEASRNIFVLEIDKAKGISAASFDKYFKSGYFLMEDEVPVPGDILKSLGISGSRTLVAGKHKVTEQGGMLYVTIPVK